MSAPRHNPSNRCVKCRRQIGFIAGELRNSVRKLSRYRDLSTLGAQKAHAMCTEGKAELMKHIEHSKKCEDCDAVKNSR